jgi:hypothetical protein
MSPAPARGSINLGFGGKIEYRQNLKEAVVGFLLVSVFLFGF